MRKLRRLPWRIPKTHHAQQQSAAAPAKAHQPHADAELERELARERERDLQPVAFAGGRYVYGTCAAPVRNTEIRRKTRHRVMPLSAPALG